MNKQNFLTLTITFSILTITGCGDSQNNSVVDDRTTTHQEDKTVKFTSRESSLIQDSAIHLLSERKRFGNQYVNEEYFIRPFSVNQQQKVQRMLEKTNNFRHQHGLPPLRYDADLSAYAYVRADENRGEYSHTRPNGEPFHTGLTPTGTRGENLNASRQSVEATFSSWVASEGHERNILDERFTRIGIAYVYDPNSPYKYYWAQIFADDEVESLYHFDPSMEPAKTPEATRDVELRIRVPMQDGKISLNSGNLLSTNNAAKAYEAKQLKNPIYRAARHYTHDDYQVIIQEPTGTFSYQTFGEVVDPNLEPVQYFNIGQPTVPEPNAHFQATYRGSSIGNINQKSHVYADVIADVNFGKQKTMDVRFTNSQIARGDIGNHHTDQSLSHASNFNFTEKLQWNDREGRFTGNTTTANFYGPNGEEIGGQFSRQISEGRYEGAFGLKKVE